SVGGRQRLVGRISNPSYGKRRLYPTAGPLDRRRRLLYAGQRVASLPRPLLPLCPLRNPPPLYVYFPYRLYLLLAFRLSLSVYWTLVLGGRLLLHLFYHHNDKSLDFLQACYTVFLLIFLQSQVEDFPDEWYLRPLFFLVPIIGLGAIADSVVRLAYLVFSQKRKLPEWQRMVASLYRNHVIVVGVGKVGVQIIKGLVQLREAVVAIERQQDSSFLDEVQDLRVPVITGDARQAVILQKAGTAKAKAIVLATDDDLANLDAAL